MNKKGAAETTWIIIGIVFALIGFFFFLGIQGNFYDFIMTIKGALFG